MIFKNSKIYDVLKWCCMVVIPALITFFGVVGATLEWGFTQPVITIAVGFNTMLGSILGIGNIRYNKQLDDFCEMVDEEDE